MSCHAQLHGTPRPFDRARLREHSTVAARELLGALLVRERDGNEPQQTIVRIVETEAYREDDPASHSHARRTTRSEPMFWREGTAYVYRSYGVHWCLNVAVEDEDVGAAVLVRAATVLTGEGAVRDRRPHIGPARDLLRGPGRLTEGLDVDGSRHDRGDLIDGVHGLTLADDGWRPPARSVVHGPRVGVRLAPELPWRYHLGVREVSAYRRSPRAASSDRP